MSALDLLLVCKDDRDRQLADLKLALHETLSVLGKKSEWHWHSIPRLDPNRGTVHDYQRDDMERGIITPEFAIGMARGTLLLVQDYLRGLS